MATVLGNVVMGIEKCGKMCKNVWKCVKMCWRPVFYILLINMTLNYELIMITSGWTIVILKCDVEMLCAPACDHSCIRMLNMIFTSDDLWQLLKYLHNLRESYSQGY